LTQPKTQPGRLSDVARHLVLPSGLASTGWPAVRKRCTDMGVSFDQWQADLVRGALGKRADGKYAATIGGCVWCIPRQVGKTFTLGAMLFALCIEHPGLLVLWTAHHGRTTDETFLAMQGFAGRPKIAPHVEHTFKGSGTQSVVFKNGSRILFGARDAGFGRGFAAVDVLVFDEAQILTERALDDMVSSTNRARHPAGALIFYIGTPPRPADSSEAFTNKRAKALAGADNLFFVELSADPDADPNDPAQWAKANPSYPLHTPAESMHRQRENLISDEAFLREALGVWEQAPTGGVIPRGMWDDCGADWSMPADRLALGVEAGPDLAWASVALAGQRSDGSWHVELDERRDGGAWVVPYVAALLDANPGIRAVVVDAGSPSKALLDDFAQARVKVTCPKVAELGAAHTRMLEGVVTGQVRHIRQPQLSAAVSVAGKRPLGDTGMWVFSRKTATSDITPIQAATLALFGAQQSKAKRPGGRRTGGPSGRVAVVL